jgi:hypothetical protein
VHIFYRNPFLSANLVDFPYVRRICCSWHFLEFCVWIFHVLKILNNEKKGGYHLIGLAKLFALQFSKESVQTPSCERLPKCYSMMTNLPSNEEITRFDGTVLVFFLVYNEYFYCSCSSVTCKKAKLLLIPMAHFLCALEQ